MGLTSAMVPARNSDTAADDKFRNPGRTEALPVRDLIPTCKFSRHWLIYCRGCLFYHYGRQSPLRSERIQMNTRVLELAIEALEGQRAEIELEIQALQSMIKDRTTPQTVTAVGKRAGRTPAQRKAQSERMRQYWQRKRASKASDKARAKPKSGPQSAAARKAISDRMKAYWAKRKAESAKKGRKTA
jgi:hypothetical protein